MKYTVNFTRKLSFIRQQGEPIMKRTDSNGETLSEEIYKKPGLPNGTRGYVPHRFHKNNKMAIDLSQEQLNKIVKEIGFYNKEGKLIVEAPINNPNAEFWRHPELKCFISNSGSTFDDEIPIEAFWLGCFRADRKFTMIGEEISPSLKSNVSYTITPIGHKITEENEQLDLSAKAMEFFIAMKEDSVKMTSILRAMGTDVKNADESSLRRAIIAKITTMKDGYSKNSGGETNIEMFIRLANEDTSSLNIEGIVSQAMSDKTIVKRGNNKYYYGDIVLGTSKKSVMEYMEKNKDIWEQIVESVNKD